MTHDYKGVRWSGCRDLNPGPLAPQATNINHLQVAVNENTILSMRRFGRQVDAKTPNRAVWTPFGLLMLLGNPLRRTWAESGIRS